MIRKCHYLTFWLLLFLGCNISNLSLLIIEPSKTPSNTSTVASCLRYCNVAFTAFDRRPSSRFIFFVRETNAFTTLFLSFSSLTKPLAATFLIQRRKMTSLRGRFPFFVINSSMGNKSTDSRTSSIFTPGGQSSTLKKSPLGVFIRSSAFCLIDCSSIKRLFCLK